MAHILAENNQIVQKMCFRQIASGVQVKRGVCSCEVKNAEYVLETITKCPFMGDVPIGGVG